MMFANIAQSRIWESDKQKLLGVNIDRHLKFDKLFIKLYKKARQKLSVLARACTILNQKR